MNERIKELIDNQQWRGWMVPEDAPDRIPVIVVDKVALGKFAQLIVTECMNTLQDFKYKSDKFDPSDLFQATHNAVLDTMIDAFKEDFGVEE